ncbi:MAG: competence/damage-inducible protein A [Planctomycetota bacterium]|nr:competence/damage-inducible protein A [Planctomycetota bacterium]
MKAIILSVGDELVLGQTVDTNSAWVSAQLAAVGCDIAAHATVPDDQPAIEAAIRAAASACDVLIISGGLGPTADDLTRQALAGVLNQPLELDKIWLGKLEEFFRQRNRPMAPTNRIQAMIPRGAKMIDNSAGTAPGIEATLQSCHIFSIPGVPKEMKLMFQQSILPSIAQTAGGAVILSRTLHTFGVGESSIAQILGDLMDRKRNPSVGTSVFGGLVSLRLNSRFPNRETAQQKLDETDNHCRRVLGDLIYGQDDQSLAQAVSKLLVESRATVSTAESCTGGLLAKMLTDIPGSSRYFQRGWITYSNQSKTDLLGVPPDLIAKQGAVSEPVASAMASGARARSEASAAMAISGVAGPEGGTPEKPVGTVCIALATQETVIVRTFNFAGDREMIRDRSAKMALTLLRYSLLGKRAPF